ncbi:hypothetical protein OG352_26905 [Streptomyces sp. NBC_01485]|uniref:hypothetical protein n=1 Tax=Streptomyces sp. NBC_01485 TaxID=2903884 RepID=UPI002E30B55C|nr:hypothetical protein [Streptomyces sp. NBC_01485]
MTTQRNTETTPATATPEAPAPATVPGTVLCDLEKRMAGEYQAKAGPYVLLRPIGGGREWEADPTAVRPATPAERLSAEVKAVNDRTGRDGVRGPGYDMTRAPVPVPGCGECAELDAQRALARVEFDYSAVSDANVLMRRHQRKDHCA